jgi:hypothetical protein
MNEVSYEEIKATTLAALAKDEKDIAFQTLRSALQYGSDTMTGETESFADAMTVFTRVTQQFGNEEFASKVQTVAEKPEDVQSLYDLGYALYEESLFGIAASVLARADKIAPGEPGIVSELVCALESEGLNREAVRVLNRYPNLASEHYLFSYLLAFNSLMAGDLAASRAAAESLPGLETEDAHPFMTARITELLNRAKKVESVCPLDGNDLRGWHYVISGSILTMLSPHGYPSPMNGRYAYLQDTVENCKQGLENLQRIISAKGMQPECIYALPGRDSGILAIAASKMFDLPVQPWPEGGSDLSAIIVAYDLGEVDINPESIAQHRPGQLLYSHAVQWTFALPIAPDVTTLLHQMLIAPWESRTGFDAETNQITTSEADTRDATTIAGDIVAATIETQEATPADEAPPSLTTEFLAAIGQFPATTSAREQIWTCSPVKSSKFS